MNTHTMNAESQRLSIYDPKRDRMISLSPYKVKAKEIYRHYIEDLGFDPSLVLPPDLVYYEKSGHFRRNPTKQVKIEGRTAYKSYLTSFTLHNVNQVHGLQGFKLLNEFTPTLNQLLAQHGGIKFHTTARCLMQKTLNGEVVQEQGFHHLHHPVGDQRAPTHPSTPRYN